MSSGLIVWTRQTGSAMPPRASSLMYRTRAKSGAYSRDFSRFTRRPPLIYTANYHRISPEFIRSRKSVPMASTAERPCILLKTKNRNKRAKQFLQLVIVHLYIYIFTTVALCLEQTSSSYKLGGELDAHYWIERVLQILHKRLELELQL